MAFLVSIKNAIFGWTRISAQAKNAHHIMNICMAMRLPYEKMKFSGDSIMLKLSRHTAKRLAERLTAEELEFEEKSGGIPILLEKYKKRWGLMSGAVIIIALLILSGSHVWDIRISGNSTLTAAQVKAELASKGFEIGSKIGKTDVDEITNAVLIDSEKISWMSINFRGNVAYVQIREKTTPDSSDINERLSNANIVAGRDGVIEYLEVMRGSAAVKEGDSVRRGELLISGITESTHGEYRTEHALGRVYAITNHSFSIKIPLQYDKKELSEPLCTKKTIKFFSKNINIFRKGGNLGASCVKIEEENSFSPFGLPPLPISIVTELSLEYETISARRTEKEASELAFFELEKLILAELSGADLLRKTISTEMTEKEFLLKCDIICSENIAVSAPFSAEKQ